MIILSWILPLGCRTVEVGGWRVMSIQESHFSILLKESESIKNLNLPSLKRKDASLHNQGVCVCVFVCLCVGEYERTETETDRDSAYIKMAGKNIFYCNNSLWAFLCLLMNRRRRHVVCMLIDLWAKCYSISPKNLSAEQQKRQSVCFVKLLSYMSEWAARTKGDLTEVFSS